MRYVVRRLIVVALLSMAYPRVAVGAGTGVAHSMNGRARPTCRVRALLSIASLPASPALHASVQAVDDRADRLRAGVERLRESMGPVVELHLQRILECPGLPAGPQGREVARLFGQAKRVASLLERQPIFRNLDQADAHDQALQFQAIATDARHALWILNGAAIARLDVGASDDAIAAVASLALIGCQQGAAKSWATIAITPQAAAAASGLSELLVDAGSLTPEQAERLRAGLSPLLKPDATFQLEQAASEALRRIELAREHPDAAGESGMPAFDLGDAAAWRALTERAMEVRRALGRARETGDVMAAAAEQIRLLQTGEGDAGWKKPIIAALDRGRAAASQIHDRAARVDAILAELADPSRNDAARRRHANALDAYRSAANLVRTIGAGDEEGQSAVLDACLAASEIGRYDHSKSRCNACFSSFMRPDLVELNCVAEWLVGFAARKSKSIEPAMRERLGEACTRAVSRMAGDRTSLAGWFASARLACMVQGVLPEAGSRLPAPARSLTPECRAGALSCMAPFIEGGGEPGAARAWLEAASDAKLMFVALVADAWFAERNGTEVSWTLPAAESLSRSMSLDQVSAAAQAFAHDAQSAEGRSMLRQKVDALETLPDWWEAVVAGLAGDRHGGSGQGPATRP
jgi:hypothetical protein